MLDELREFRLWAYRQLKKWQPDSVKIRFHAKCDACKRKGTLMSYQLPGTEVRLNSKLENCGYYCPSCGFGMAGGREISEDPFYDPAEDLD